MFEFPSSLPATVDLYYTTRQQRLETQRRVDELQEQESALKAYIIESLSGQDSKGISGLAARVEVKEKERPAIDDWDTFMQHVAASGEYELIQRRLSDAAIKERWEQGEAVPGTKRITVKELSVHKVGR